VGSHMILAELRATGDLPSSAVRCLLKLRNFGYLAISIQSYASKLSILLRFAVPFPFAVSPKTGNI